MLVLQILYRSRRYHAGLADNYYTGLADIMQVLQIIIIPVL